MRGSTRTTRPASGAAAWPADRRPAYEGGGEAVPPDPREAIVFTIEGDPTVAEGASAAYTISFSGYALQPGETVSIDVALVLGTAGGDDFTSTLAEALDEGLTSGISRSGTRLTWDDAADPSIVFALEVADDLSAEGAEAFEVHITDPDHGSISTASVATTIEASDAFVGVLDMLTATAVSAWSVDWKLKAAYSGYAVRLRRSSDNTEANIGFDSYYNTDVAAAASHIEGGSGFSVTVFDQVNSANLSESSAGNQPLYVASMMNSLPGVRCQDTGDKLRGTLGVMPSGNQAFTMVFIGRARGQNPSNSLQGAFFMGDASHSAAIAYSTLSGENKWWFGGAFNASAAVRVGVSDQSNHMFVHRHTDSGLSDFWVDGVRLAESVSNVCSFDNGMVGLNSYDGSVGADLPGMLTGMIFLSAIGDDDIAVLHSMLAARYGVTLP